MSPKSSPLTRRDFLRLSAGAATAAFLASRQLPLALAQETTPIPGLSGDVVVWGWTGVIEQFQAVIPDMQALYPDVNVRVEEMGYDDTHTNILAAVNTGVGVPDVVNFDTNYLGEFADGLTDLTDRLQPYLDEIIPISVKLGTYQGKILGVPQDSQPAGMFYRSDKFEEYGIDAEKIETYADLVAAAREVSAATKGEVKMLCMDVGSKLSMGDPHLIIDLLLVQNGLGGTYFNRDDDKVVVDTPEAIEAMEVLRPYLNLGERMGSLLGQLMKRPHDVTITYAGEVAALDTRPLGPVILKGLLGQRGGGNVVYRLVGECAKQNGIKVRETVDQATLDYTSLIKVHLDDHNGEITDVWGTIFGKKNPCIVRLGWVYMDGIFEGNVLVIQNHDRPGVIGNIGNTLARHGVNIGRFQLGRRDDLAVCMVNIDAPVERAVIDKNCVIGHNARVGRIEEGADGLGIVTIGKNTHLPTGIVVGRGVRVGSDLRADDFTQSEIPENATIPSGNREYY